MIFLGHHVTLAKLLYLWHKQTRSRGTCVAGSTEGMAPERDILKIKCLESNSSILTGIMILYGINLYYEVLKSAKNHVFFF